MHVIAPAIQFIAIPNSSRCRCQLRTIAPAADDIDNHFQETGLYLLLLVNFMVEPGHICVKAVEKAAFGLILLYMPSNVRVPVLSGSNHVFNCVEANELWFHDKENLP